MGLYEVGESYFFVRLTQRHNSMIDTLASFQLWQGPDNFPKIKYLRCDNYIVNENPNDLSDNSGKMKWWRNKAEFQHAKKKYGYVPEYSDALLFAKEHFPKEYISSGYLNYTGPLYFDDARSYPEKTNQRYMTNTDRRKYTEYGDLEISMLRLYALTKHTDHLYEQDVSKWTDFGDKHSSITDTMKNVNALLGKRYGLTTVLPPFPKNPTDEEAILKYCTPTSRPNILRKLVA